ncbi:MAG: ribbon-helix-helix protein, CopG family [Geminicoccaceae bacterium]
MAQPHRKVVLEPDLDREIERLAKDQDRSISAQIRVLLRLGLQAQKATETRKGA